MASLGLIPLFPLSLVLYPEEALPLHIYEPRYRDLVRDCLDDASAFGIVMAQDSRIADVGCTARIQEVVRRHEDGRMDILVRGQDRFRITDINRDRSYMQADAEPVVETGEEHVALGTERVITQHIKLLELAGRTPSPSAYEGKPMLSYFIGLNSGLSLEQKQEMLELLDESSRVQFLVHHLSEFIPRVEKAEALRRTITSNGHFPNFPQSA